MFCFSMYFLYLCNTKRLEFKKTSLKLIFTIMVSKELLDLLVSDTEEVKELIGKDKRLYRHRHFGLQIDIDNRNGKNQSILYDLLLMFLTSLPHNYVGLNQDLQELKDKVCFFLPKKAFREYVRELFKSYTYKKIEEKLCLLGGNKVATQKDVVVDLFVMKEFDGLEDFWGLIIDISSIPYLCSPYVLFALAITKAIPYIPGDRLELSEMVEERLKAGLYIPLMMYVINNSEFTVEEEESSES